MLFEERAAAVDTAQLLVGDGQVDHIAAQREIVPIALEGTRRVLRDGTWLPRPGRITITICPPIPPPPTAQDWQQIVHLRDSAREIIARFAREPLL